MKSQVAGNICVEWVPGESKLADLMTKTTLAGNVTHSIVEIIFHNKAIKWNDDKKDNGRVD